MLDDALQHALNYAERVKCTLREKQVGDRFYVKI